MDSGLTPSPKTGRGGLNLSLSRTQDSSSGIEGVVAKHTDHSYRPGVRGWQKLRGRLTGEAVVAGVLGPLHAPRVLLLAASYRQTRGQARAALPLFERAYATASVTSALAVQHGCRAHMDQQSDGWFLSAAYRRMA